MDGGLDAAADQIGAGLFVIRPDGTIDDSASLSTLPPSTDQAVIRAALWEYVQKREGYSYDTARYRYDIVSGMSDATTKAHLSSMVQLSQSAIPAGDDRQEWHGHGAADFGGVDWAWCCASALSADFGGGHVHAPTTTWTATEQFEEVDTMPDAERLDDPGGIIITSYQDEEDTAP